MGMPTPPVSPPATSDRKPLPPVDRRVLGVLIEKAKTTPEQYPLTLSALVAGANQKSNRHPMMQLEAEAVEEALDRLRQLGAVTEVQGSGRVPRYRHQAYQWLGVEKVELAVMAELLLRGAQTVGQLRGRAARMEPIADLAALGPHLDSLREKGLAVYLTPQGRGCMVTHTLYPPAEMAKIRAEHSAGGPHEARSPAPPGRPESQGADPAPSEQAASHRATRGGDAPVESSSPLGDELAAVRSQVDGLQAELRDLQHQWRQALERTDRELQAIRRQLDGGDRPNATGPYSG